MSAYRKLSTEFRSKYRLREALAKAGVEFEECTVEQHLIGWHARTRPETATFIVRRKHIGPSSNDLGYHWNGHAFEEIVSEFDSGHAGCTAIRQAVKREYAVITATSAARSKGYNVARVNEASGQVRLIVTGRI